MMFLSRPTGCARSFACFTLALLFIALAGSAHAAQVVFLNGGDEGGAFDAQVEVAADFYGVDLVTIAGQGEAAIEEAAGALQGEDLVGLIVDARALDEISVQQVQRLSQELARARLPIFIGELTSESDPQKLRPLAGGTLRGVSASDSQWKAVKFSDDAGLANELAGHWLTAPVFEAPVVEFAEGAKFEPVLSAGRAEGSTEAVIAAVAPRGPNRRAWLAAATNPPVAEESWAYVVEQFHRIAPLMMFLRSEGGDRVWHKVQHVANHTIDDPWLTDPYGNVKYFDLLTEMQHSNYHTTIAFVPWNFDRSKPQVVSLFKQHPEYYSIAIHGNNHDRREFYKYTTEAGDPMPARPFEEQEADIRQALARMEAFESLTGLDYERIMIFPHSISPEATLGLLKKYNFLATVNLKNWPVDVAPPEDDPYFYLRGFTRRYADFLSYRRYPPRGLTKGQMAVQLFLGNPLIFYTHQIDFSDGIHLMNETAEAANEVEPELEWTSLQGVVQGEWRQRRLADGSYQVLAFSPDVVIRNPSNEPRRYYVRLVDGPEKAYTAVEVAGRPVEYDRDEGGVSLTMTVGPGETVRSRIDYVEEVDLTQVAVAKNDRWANLLRRISDFRDITLTTNPLGIAIHRVYYGSGIYRLGLKNLLVITLAIGLAAGGGLFLLRRRQRVRVARIDARAKT